MTDPSLSLIIPLFNERESLAALCAEIGAIAREQALAIEIIFIDDGSTDGSWDLVKELAAHDPRIRGLKFRRNFGKAAALQAGFHVARGTRAMTLDADLQDDPAEIPNFLKQLDSGYDLVSGWKKVRHDPWHKVLPSRVFNGMVSWLTGVKLHDHNCGMKAFDTAIFKEIRLYGELHRFVPVLAAAQGFRVGELVIQHRARKFGRSKYGFRRFLRGFLDLLTVKYLTTYGRRPMHLYGLTTILIVMAALLLAVIGICWSPLLSSLTFLSIVLGVLGSMMVFLNGLQAETLAALRMDEPYSIVERIG